jgi:hypothetical protein
MFTIYCPLLFVFRVVLFLLWVILLLSQQVKKQELNQIIYVRAALH